jgi:Uma2 family endonuclease
MFAAGVFEQKRRVELIGGYVVDRSPASSEHNYVVMRLNELYAPLMPQFKLWIQGTLRIDGRNVFDPDVMLLRPRDLSYKESLPTPADVALVVEVAGSSLPGDAGVKLPIFAANEIQDYWIADLDREVLIVHRKPAEKSYADRQEFSKDKSIAPLAAPQFEITVGAIFD